MIIKLNTADLNWLIFFSPDSLILHNLNLFGDIYEQEFYFFFLHFIALTTSLIFR